MAKSFFLSSFWRFVKNDDDDEEEEDGIATKFFFTFVFG